MCFHLVDKKVRDDGQMAASCLLLSQACSALSWLDPRIIPPQDSTEGATLPRAQQCGCCTQILPCPRQIFMWKLGVFYSSTRREQTASITCAGSDFLPCEGWNKPQSVVWRLFKELPFDSLSIWSLLVPFAVLQSWKRSVQGYPAEERARPV